MAYKNPVYPLRVSKELIQKIKYIADRNSRSINKEIEQIIKQYILNFEKKNGVIEISEQDQDKDE